LQNDKKQDETVLSGWGHYRVNWYAMHAYRYCFCDSSVLFLAKINFIL